MTDIPIHSDAHFVTLALRKMQQIDDPERETRNYPMQKAGSAPSLRRCARPAYRLPRLRDSPWLRTDA